MIVPDSGDGVIFAANSLLHCRAQGLLYHFILPKEESMKGQEHINDRRSTKLENVMAASYIPFMSGRPEREEIICKDDLLNLKILINRCADVKTFVESA
jgi:hypothetical protein